MGQSPLGADVLYVWRHSRRRRRKGGGEYRFHGRTPLTELPSLKMRRNLWYDDCQLIKAWDQTVLAIQQLGKRGGAI